MAAPDLAPGLIARWQSGDIDALDQLLPLIYQDLRAIAARELRRRSGHETLQPTALINEMVLRLLGVQASHFSSVGHFFCASARMMRQILVDRARHHNALKRGGDWQRESLTGIVDLSIPEQTDLQALDAALERLGELDERIAHIVELRYFAGLSVAEVAAALQVDQRTVYRDWALARSWLRDNLEGPEPT